METISRAAARRLALHCQGLNTRWKLPAGKRGAAEVVGRLGYVQIDTISVIERAHHHVLATRHADYRTGMLYDLLADRQVFEYWAHAAAYLPFSDYRFYLPGMKTFYKGRPEDEFRKENKKLIREVYRRVEKEGPLSALDFEHQQDERGPWWDWKPAKRALEILFNTGELMVTARDNFRRVYDLAERIVPDGLDTSEPPSEEVARHFAWRALAVHGVATLAEVRKMFGNSGAKEALAEMREAEEVIEVRVQGVDERFYALREILRELPSRPSRRVYLLSPFDNFTIDRDRLERLFGFCYKIECYTPATKRRYGYFTLPILWQGKLVGRLDPKAERKEKRFVVKNVVLEESVKESAALADALAKALREFARFHGCGEIVVEKTEPPQFKDLLTRVL